MVKTCMGSLRDVGSNCKWFENYFDSKVCSVSKNKYFSVVLGNDNSLYKVHPKCVISNSVKDKLGFLDSLTFRTSTNQQSVLVSGTA